MALSITPLFSLLQHDFPIPALKGFVVLPLDHERLDMRREVRVPGRRSSQGQSLYSIPLSRSLVGSAAASLIWHVQQLRRFLLCHFATTVVPNGRLNVGMVRQLLHRRDISSGVQ